MKKQCNICMEIKESSEFYNQRRRSKKRGEYIYYNPECKECTKQKAMKWKSNNREAVSKSNFKYTQKKDYKFMRRRIIKKYNDSGKRKEWEISNSDKMKAYRLKNMNKEHQISNEEWEDCKQYFNHRCAYCGLAIEKHFVRHNGQTILGDFHREHAINKGENDLSNCIPSCESCNCEKYTSDYFDWYLTDNSRYSEERLNKITKWLNEDYKQYIKKDKLIKNRIL